ncbi:YlaF family protein [Aquibacillus sp. 3ASR75-11]|uniref:YlaF family protein n=1 Tax=Terrihalobacillus insolitus TaxID=2950438 RepID=A0A9X3WPW9_9BACI|nr:DUF5325 family protein [Terrihalobacillus insolitus]MDC3412786.1 YlaF family protein [Terrihalobacillus insolitus]MDC3423737.1 YlaF family protein [Terrihalobacillus insolitus]
MKKIQFPMLLLAFLVILSYMLVGVAIGYRNYILAIFFVVLGFVLMGFGLARKRRNNNTVN